MLHCSVKIVAFKFYPNRGIHGLDESGGQLSRKAKQENSGEVPFK